MILSIAFVTCCPISWTLSWWVLLTIFCFQFQLCQKLVYIPSIWYGVCPELISIKHTVFSRIAVLSEMCQQLIHSGCFKSLIYHIHSIIQLQAFFPYCV
ncbi:hypothetical protein XELAEV_18005969mg [Xenopus laevis]|uniref:Uncharacterized protein n=1 Tax=Xenopus laevis TaxID=8355 RepID=A0A974DXV1_XENLA|nr:hypothetical protein XELAEV_18005969mg [Xenopus laevis]